MIHTEKLGREEPGFVAAGAGAQLDDGVALVGLVFRQQQNLDLVLELGDALVERAQLLLGERFHFALTFGDHGFEVVVFGACLLPGLDAFDQGRQVAVFLRELGEFAAARGSVMASRSSA